MLDRSLKVNDRNASRGEALRDIRYDASNHTLDDKYRLWMFYQSYDSLKRYDMENTLAFITALMNSRVKKTSKEHRRDMCGLYHWYKYVWLHRRYSGLWRRIVKVRRQIAKAGR